MLVLAVFALAGCAAQTDTHDTTLAPAASASVAPSANASASPVAGSYKLTSAEEKFDCPRLTGQMRVRIANMRAAMADKGGSAAGRVMQSVAAPVFGGSRRGVDPQADLQVDRAKLDAFNKRLAEKKCKTLDIDAELRGEAPASASPKAGAKKAG